MTVPPDSHPPEIAQPRAATEAERYAREAEAEARDVFRPRTPAEVRDEILNVGGADDTA